MGFSRRNGALFPLSVSMNGKGKEQNAPILNGMNGAPSVPISALRSPNLSGINSSACCQYLGSFWISFIGTKTCVFPGINVSSTVRPCAGVSRYTPVMTAGLMRSASFTMSSMKDTLLAFSYVHSLLPAGMAASSCPCSFLSTAGYLAK